MHYSHHRKFRGLTRNGENRNKTVTPTAPWSTENPESSHLQELSSNPVNKIPSFPTERSLHELNLKNSTTRFRISEGKIKKRWSDTDTYLESSPLSTHQKNDLCRGRRSPRNCLRAERTFLDNCLHRSVRSRIAFQGETVKRSRRSSRWQGHDMVKRWWTGSYLDRAV